MQGLRYPRNLAYSESDQFLFSMNADLDGYLEKLRGQKKSYIDELRKWFWRWERLPCVLFFGSTTLIVIGSVSLPYLVNAGFQQRDTAITCVSLGVALLTSLNSLYAWQLSWQKRLRIATALDNLSALWELDMFKAEEEEPPKAKADAHAATASLFTKAYQLVAEENSELFQRIRPPDLSSPHP